MKRNNLAYREAFLAGRLGIRAKILIYLAVLAGFIISAVWMLQGVLVYGGSRGLNVPPKLLDAVRDDIDEFVGAAPQFDDITMMGMKYDGPEDKGPVKMTVDAKTENLDKVLAFAEEQLAKANCPVKEQTQIGVAVEEIFVNIALYAYKPETGKADITFDVDKEKKEAIITFRDKGVAFNPLEKQDPDVTQSAEDRPIGGLGIFLVRQIMDDIRYERKDNKNILTLTKNI